MLASRFKNIGLELQTVGFLDLELHVLRAGLRTLIWRCNTDLGQAGLRTLLQAHFIDPWSGDGALVWKKKKLEHLLWIECHV